MDVQQEIIFRQIGAKVAYYRTLRGMTQEKLSERMGLHKSVISWIERGKYHNDLSLAMLLKIAEKWREPLLLEENDEEEK